MTNPYAQHNEESKANFNHVYDLPDPRGYFETLGSLDPDWPVADFDVDVERERLLAT